MRVEIQARRDEAQRAPLAADAAHAVIRRVDVGGLERNAAILAPQAVLNRERLEGLGPDVVLVILKVDFVDAAAVRADEERIVRHAHGAPQVAAIEFRNPDFVAVADVDALRPGVPAVFINQRAHDFHSLAGGGRIAQRHVLRLIAVDDAVVAVVHQGVHLLAVFRRAVDAAGRFAHRHAVFVDDGVIRVQILEGILRLGHFAHDHAAAVVLRVRVIRPVAPRVAVHHDVSGDSLAAFHLRDDPHAEIIARRVAGVRHHRRTVRSRVLADAVNRTGHRA